jgi:hypothetical protein
MPESRMHPGDSADVTKLAVPAGQLWHSERASQYVRRNRHRRSGTSSSLPERREVRREEEGGTLT